MARTATGARIPARWLAAASLAAVVGCQLARSISGRLVEIDLRRQLLLVVSGGSTLWAFGFDTTTGQVVGDCYPRRTGREFLAFLRKAVKPHAGREVHVVLDNLSTHDTPAVRAWLAAHPNVSFHFTPIGSSWLNMIETWFSIITRQEIRRGTFSSVNALVFAIRDYITAWNADAAPFVWTATADEILAKVAWVQANVRKLVDNNAK